jgi:type II secretory ATPase GspE/PulE/Tfp pilus assembly ATPase PilB-like protein
MSDLDISETRRPQDGKFRSKNLAHWILSFELQPCPHLAVLKTL